MMRRLPTLPSWLAVLLSIAASAACAERVADPSAPVAPDSAVDAGASAGDPSVGPVPAGDTVASVAVGRYLGTWYEIASIPQGFQRNCAATTATYGAVDATTISVDNRCRVGGLDGDPVSITGTATVVDLDSNARLEVDFGFARAPYWIVDLGVSAGDEPYPWAIVSNPDRSALWILARTPAIEPARYDVLIERLEQRGYTPARLVRTLQPG